MTTDKILKMIIGRNLYITTRRFGIDAFFFNGKEVSRAVYLENGGRLVDDVQLSHRQQIEKHRRGEKRRQRDKARYWEGKEKASKKADELSVGLNAGLTIGNLLTSKWVK